MRQRVVHRMAVVLGGHGGNLSLRGAELAHVKASKGSVDVHEQAVGRLGHGPFRWLNTVPHLQQPAFVILDRGYVPGTVENAEHFGFVGAKHFLGTNGQRYLSCPRAHILHRQVESRTGTGAGVLDVENRDGLEAHRTQRNLAADHGLAFECALCCVGKVCRLDVADGQSGIGQRGVHGSGGQLLDIAVKKLAGRRHADADYVNGGLRVGHGNASIQKKRRCEISSP